MVWTVVDHTGHSSNMIRRITVTPTDLSFGLVRRPSFSFEMHKIKKRKVTFLNFDCFTATNLKKKKGKLYHSRL